MRDPDNNLSQSPPISDCQESIITLAVEETTRSKISYALCYLFLNGLISGIIAGGAEFGIAFGMYQYNKQLTLWAFPNTLSGDCALTHFIQVAVTWYAEEVLVGWDMIKGNTPVILFAQKSLPKSKFIKWYFQIERGIIFDEEELEYSAFRSYLKGQFIRHPQKSLPLNLFDWLFRKSVRGLILGAILWTIEWPIAMGIIAGIGEKIGSVEYTFYGYYPEVMKLIYGFVLGLISTPMIILVIILRYQWYRLYIQNVEQSEQLFSTNLEQTMKKDSIYARLQVEPYLKAESSKDTNHDTSSTI